MNSVKDNESEIIDKIASHYKAILELLGEDVSREGLLKTPVRAAKAMYYATRGYRQNAQDVIHGALFKAESHSMVMVRDIEFYSLCEHHILPFFGHVSVAYIPGDRIVGISKLARMVDMYARRLQVQERFASQLYEALQDALGCEGVIVQCTARHMCMMMRGVQKQDSETVTIASTGVFDGNVNLRNEFFSSLK